MKLSRFKHGDLYDILQSSDSSSIKTFKNDISWKSSKFNLSTTCDFTTLYHHIKKCFSKPPKHAKTREFAWLPSPNALIPRRWWWLLLIWIRLAEPPPDRSPLPKYSASSFLHRVAIVPLHSTTLRAFQPTRTARSVKKSSHFVSFRSTAPLVRRKLPASYSLRCTRSVGRASRIRSKVTTTICSQVYGTSPSARLHHLNWLKSDILVKQH